LGAGGSENPAKMAVVQPGRMPGTVNAGLGISRREPRWSGVQIPAAPPLFPEK